MNKLLPVVMATLAFFAASGAKAADAALPMKASPTPIEPPFSWTGFYLGANGGGGSAWSHLTALKLPPLAQRLFAAALAWLGASSGGKPASIMSSRRTGLLALRETAIGPRFRARRVVAQYSQVGLSPALPPDAQQTTSHSIASRLCAAVWATHSAPVQASPRVCCCMVPADGHGANYRATARPPAWACFVRAPPFRLPVVGPLSTIPPMVGQQVPDWKSPLRGTGPLGLNSFTCSSTTSVLISAQSPRRLFLEQAQRRLTSHQMSTWM